MGDIPVPVELCWLAENDKLAIFFQHILHPPDTVEPYQFYRTRLIHKLRHQTLSALLPHQLAMDNLSFELDISSF